MATIDSSNTLSVFIENQGYTLADIPLFFEDDRFRDFLVSNVKYTAPVADYWRHSFAKQKAREQNSKIDATLTRLYILLSREYVRSVVGQAQTTIDFASIMRDRKVVFLSLPASLPEDDKRFLGTILMSEVLHAAQHRPRDNRPHFSIFVDEFQHFVNSRDFGQLITEARKFGIAATISHQERLGQFSDDKKIQGATATAANKVFFQLSVADAHELAAEFAEEPPADIRIEQELVTSRSPVWDLLRGHKDPQICAFADKHIRPLKERLEDISQALGTERLDRMECLDEAGLYRIDEL